MPRPPRVRFEGAVYHITAHAVGRDLLFSDDADRRGYLDLLRHVIQRAQVTLLAFVLMDTHVHLVLRTSLANVSSAVQWLHGRHAALFNRQARRRGHLFGGRFYSTVIDSDAYLLEVTRYAHLNPVRAGLVGRPEEFPWSSYRQYLTGSGNGLADPRMVLGLLGSDRQAQCRAYRRFVEEPLVVLLGRHRRGSPAWERAALAAVADALGVLRADVLERRIPQVRPAAAGLLVDALGVSPFRVARLLGVHVESIRRSVRSVRAGSLSRQMMQRVVRARDVLSAAGGSAAAHRRRPG